MRSLRPCRVAIGWSCEASARSRSEKRDARIGVNPRTGDKIAVSEKHFPFFKLVAVKLGLIKNCDLNGKCSDEASCEREHGAGSQMATVLPRSGTRLAGCSPAKVDARAIGPQAVEQQRGTAFGRFDSFDP
jgi:hypothetical protein